MRSLLVVILALGAASCSSNPSKSETTAKSEPKPPIGPAPPLPAGFPPLYPGATLKDVTTNSGQSGWEHGYLYTGITAKAADIVSFYRKELPKFDMRVVAEGAGPYGAMLRAQSSDKKRLVMVDVDAPEDKPKEPAKITINILDSR